MIPGSWQMASIVTLLFLIAAGSLALRPRKRGATKVRPARTWPLADYSAKRARMLAHLGDDYLLARPINRLRQTELPAMLRRQAN